MSVNTKGNECDNQAVDETGTGCEGRECLRIHKQLRELHEENLRRIDDELGRDGTEVKLKAMQSWISDLEEQHTMFIQTMVQLEQEAGDRVSLLQEGLHRSSQAALAYRTKLDDYDRDDFLEKLVSSARNEELQHILNQKLQNDIANLLELIRRVREENSWDATGLTFNEVTCEDIFGTEDIFPGRMVGTVRDSQISASVSISVETTTHCAHHNQGEDAVIADPNDGILRLHLDLEKCKDAKQREVSEMEAKIVMLKFDIEQKDEQIRRCIRRIQAFHNICNKLNEGSIEHQSHGNAVNETPLDEFLRCSLEDFHERFQRALEEKEELTAEVKCLKTELKESKTETEELSRTVNDMKQSNKDIRESLAAEVAEKHDEIITLRHMIQCLIKNCRAAESMVRLKDGIIKQFRKDRKASGFKEKNNMDTAEHLNLLLISDNTIKKQKENINGLQDTVKKYENDLNEIQIKAEQVELELKDSKLKYTQQITDQEVMINDLKKIVRTSQTEVEMLKEKCEKYERSAEAVQEERENLKTEMEKLQYNLMSREKVAANQEEIINILQDSVNIAQKEQQDLQQKLKDAEAGKEKLLNALQEERKKAENLQEALMITKQQLEDLQGNKYEVIIKDHIIRRLHVDVSEIKSQYSNCYAEVMKQEKVLDSLRESIDHLKTEIVNLEQDISLLELHLAEKLKVLHFSKTRELEKLTAESQKGNDACKNTVESLNGKVSFLNNLLKEKCEVLARIEADKEVLQNVADQYNSLMAEANQEKANLKLEIKDLQGQLEKFEVNYQCAMEDGKKYQDMILEAANREVRLQKEFTEQERQVLEKLRRSQTEELRMCDVVNILNTELLNIKTELAEREAQLQSVACQNHLSTQTIEKLQKDLELKDETIDCLQGNMNEMNLNFITTVKMLKGKDQLIQNLQSQNSELQRQLESENLRSAVCEEVHTLEMEALCLKSQVKRCTQLQDGMNVEVRECLSVPETWWWDDFWQM